MKRPVIATNNDRKIQISKRVINLGKLASEAFTSRIHQCIDHVFHGSEWTSWGWRGRDLSDARSETDSTADCGGDYGLWDWRQNNQSTDGVDLLFIRESEWDASAKGCGGGSSAWISCSDSDIQSVEDTAESNTGKNCLIGAGSESDGPYAISIALVKTGHCWRVGHDQGCSTADSDAKWVRVVLQPKCFVFCRNFPPCPAERQPFLLEQSVSGAAGPARVDVDRVDGTDVDTQHTVDTLVLVGRIGLDLALGVTRGIDPLEDVDRAVLQAGPVRDTDIEVDGDVRAVDALGLFGGFVAVGGPHAVVLVAVHFLVGLLELRVDSHT